MQRFLATEILVEVRILWQKTDRFPALNQATVTAENFRPTAAGGNEAEDDFEGRALSGAVGTKQPVNLTRFDAKIEIAHCDNRMSMKWNRENLGQSPNSDGRITHSEFQNRAQ